MSDEIVFSSGKSIYANNNIVGIDAELEISEGYDGSIFIEGHNGEELLTKPELIELADMMIDRWQRFKAKHST